MIPGDIFNSLLNFDAKLVPGDLVEIRWTANHRYHAARALVQRKNRLSVACTLVEALDGYPKGQSITVPRVAADRWSHDNGVYPLPPLQGIVLDEKGARMARPLRRDSDICELLGGAAALEAEFFYTSTHPELHDGAVFVALRDPSWAGKSLPIHDKAIPLRGPMFIVRRPYNVGGYWRSLTTRDVAEFTERYGIAVEWGDVQQKDVR